MDILPLLPSFTDPSLPSSGCLLWLEMVKAHGNLSKNEIKIVIKYLDDALKKSKSNDSEPLQLLYHLVESCSASVLVENCLNWMDKLMKIIQVNCNEIILSLACDIIICIIPYITQNSELNRQFCNSVLSNLVSILLKEDIINAQKLRCLKEVMTTFPGPCRQFQKEIESFITKIFLKTTDVHMQQSVAQCLIVLPIITTDPEVGFNQCFKKLMKTIYDTLKDLFEKNEDGDSVWKSEYTKSFRFPLISSSCPIQKFKVLQQRFNLLCYCLNEMLSVDYPCSKQIPVKDVIGFITRVILVTPFSIKCSTTDDLMFAGVLPILHESVFSILKSLIASCRTLLIPESSTINKIILKGLKWTSTSQTIQIGTINKSFSDLRCEIYSTLKLWAETMSVASGLTAFSSELYKHFMNDMRNADKKILLENSSDDKYRRKRKRGASFTGMGSVGPLKDDPFINSNLCINCLKALKSVHLAIGATVHPTVYSDICKSTLHLICEVQSTVSKRPTPYDEPECRRALYQALYAFVLTSPKETGNCLQLSIQIFSRGRQDSYQKLSSFCLEALTVCEQLIHARLPSLQFLMEITNKPEIKNTEAKLANDTNDLDELPTVDSPEEEINETNEEVNEEEPTADKPEAKLNGFESEESVEIIDVVITEDEIMDSTELVTSPTRSSSNEEKSPVHSNVEEIIEVEETKHENLGEESITPTKTPLINLNNLSVPSDSDEAILTVEEMLQDLVSENSNE